MSEKSYLYNKDYRGVATVTLNRPEIHNAFNDQLILDLTTLFNEISNDESVRVVILTGASKSFCAGADLNWMKGMINYSQKDNFLDSQKLNDMFHAINSCRKPVIGKINGSALGGGVGIVACCDFVITSKNAKFGFTEVKLGLLPAVISPYVIAKIGENFARATFLSGEKFSAEYAERIGLVHLTVDPNNLDSEIERKLKDFLGAGPCAVSLTKDLIKNVTALPKDKITDYTCNAIANARTSTEGQEGMNALLEKREPKWSTCEKN